MRTGTDRKNKTCQKLAKTYRSGNNQPKDYNGNRAELPLPAGPWEPLPPTGNLATVADWVVSLLGAYLEANT
jgi:hypothetical protein